MQNNKEKIIEDYARENNLIYAIGGSEPFSELKPILEKQETPFVTATVEERISPKLIFPEAKAIICLGLSYNKKYCGKIDDKLRGNISSGAVGEDYHITLKNHLNRLCELLEIEEQCFVDTGALVDRAVAIRCGLGVRGKHFSVINHQIGSMFFIGYILTNLELKKTPIKEDFEPCKDCDKCIKACPYGAIKEDSFDYKKCISYLTQAKDITKEDYKIIGKQLYGCDICQRVCPCNAEGVEKIYDEKMLEEFMPSLDEILSLSNKEFNARFSKTAAGWRGKKVIQRNAIIALLNSKDKRAIELLEKYKNDNREDMAELIRYALEKKKWGEPLGYWNTRGLRGNALEELINLTNDVYRQKNLAIIQKIPTPITPVKISEDGRNITLAYFEKQSTVDYIGAVQGIPVCFDAKETKLKSLPMNNIHPHQIEFMEDFSRQDGIAFLLVHFSFCDEYYLLPFEVLKSFYENSQKEGGRKSIPYSAFEDKYRIYNKNGFVLHYLEAVSTYLKMKEG